jgi:glycosyltransferase involved in cell wall biosynthesis
MRILQVIARLDPGGAEDIAIRLAAAARASGHDAAVAAAPGRWVDRIHGTGATHLPIVEPAPGRAAASSIAGLRRALRWAPDLVHTHNVKMTAATRVALGFGRRPPVLTTIHGLPPERYRLGAKVLRVSSDLTVACAPAVATALRGAGLPAARLITIPNGARRTEASQDRVAALRTELGLGAGHVVVGIGRLVPEKAWHHLIEALAGVPDVTVVIAGEGPERARLETALVQHRVRGLLPGHLHDVDALLGLATVVCQTSTSEGLPLALIEAASVGRAIVTRTAGGITDVLGPRTAVLVEGDDPGVFGRAVERLLQDDAERRRLGAAARLAAVAWSPEVMERRYLDTYEACLGRRLP